MKVGKIVRLKRECMDNPAGTLGVGEAMNPSIERIKRQGEELAHK